MRMFVTSKNKYLSNDMKIFGTCSIPLMIIIYIVMLASCLWLLIIIITGFSGDDMEIQTVHAVNKIHII